jgi:hypothetical protein
MPQTAVQQPRLATLLMPPAPAAKRPLAHSKQLGRLQLIEFAQFIATQHIAKLDQSHTL